MPEVCPERKLQGTVTGEIDSFQAFRRRLPSSIANSSTIPSRFPWHLILAAPLVHAISKAARKAFYEGYVWFVATFRTAAEASKAGDRSAPFPAGSFPPALPFVAG